MVHPGQPMMPFDAGPVCLRSDGAPLSRQRTANGWSRRPDRLLAIRPL